MRRRSERHTARSTVWLCLLLVGMAALAIQPSAGAAISVTSPQLQIGKVDPGHQAEFERDVANTGDVPVDVQVQLSCPCEPHLTVSPTEFTLPPGDVQTLTMSLDVPDDAEPGVHDVRVKVIERVSAGAGGTGQSAIDIVANYQVRTVGLYADPATDPYNVSARIVNALESGVDIEVTGTLATDPPRAIEAVHLHAAGSESGSRVARFMVAVPFEEGDADGVYTLHLQASWQNESAGTAPGSRTLEVPIGWGVPTPDLPSDEGLPDLGRGEGDSGTAGAADGPAAGADDDDTVSLPFSATWLIVAAALVGGVVAGVWLGRRKP